MGKKAAKKAAKAASLAAIQSAAVCGEISPGLQEHLRALGLIEEPETITTTTSNVSQEVEGHGDEQASGENVTVVEPAVKNQEATLSEEALKKEHNGFGIGLRSFKLGWDDDYVMTSPARSFETESRIITPSSSTNDESGDTELNDTQDKGVAEPSIKGTVVARCCSCARMAWLQSPRRHLAEIAVSGAEGHGGVVFMRCGRCGAGNVDSWGGKAIVRTSIDVCPETWRGSDVIRIAESLAGREMHVLDNGKGGTAVIDLLSLIRELLDDEEWGEVLEADYHSGKRGKELCSKAMKGGLV